MSSPAPTAAAATGARAAPALEARGIVKRFGALAALAGVDLVVAEGERRALIGPNGAGKTTLFHVVSGELEPTAGRIAIAGRDVTRLPVHERARLGLGRTFQRTNLFPRLTVWENVRLAVQVRRGLGPQTFRPVETFAGVAAESEALIVQVGLADRRRDRVTELSHGEQRQLELALALAVRPRVLLLDEPTAGMSPAETARMAAMLAGLPRSITLVIIEHDMDVVAALADNITVLHLGEVLADGPAASVRADPRVQDVYLGGVEEEVGLSGVHRDARQATEAGG